MRNLYVTCVIAALVVLGATTAFAQFAPQDATCGLELEILPYASIVNEGDDVLHATVTEGQGTVDFVGEYEIWSKIVIRCNANWSATIQMDQPLTNAAGNTIEIWLVESRFRLDRNGINTGDWTLFMPMQLEPIDLVSGGPGWIIIYDHQKVTINYDHPAGLYTANEVYTLTANN